MKNDVMWKLKKQSRLNILLIVTMIIASIIKIFLYAFNIYFDVYIIIKHINQDRINFWLDMLIILSLGLIIFLIVQRKYLKVIVLSMFLLIITLVTSFSDSYGFGNTYPKYYYFNALSSDNTLIVEENSWLLGGWSNFYIKKNFLFATKLNQWITTDDGYRPFSSGDYELLWIDSNNVKLVYGFGESNIVKTEIIKLK